MAEVEPPQKKLKLETDKKVILNIIDTYINTMLQTNKNLKAVLSDEFYRPVPLVKVYVGHVKDPRDLSRIISILNEKIPLKELQHLKRVRKREVLLCPIDFLNGISSIQEYLKCNVQELTDVFEYFKEIDVPLLAPKIRSQYNAQIWSCNFHPNKYYEKLVSDNFFSSSELKVHIIFMQMVFKVAQWYFQLDDNADTSPDIFSKVNATIITDPTTNSVVSAAFCNTSHPVQHSTMLAIDNVAKTQNGGAWGVTSQNSDADCTLAGIDEDLLNYLKNIFPKSAFGARVYKSKRDSTADNLEPTDAEGPYLCTGYYVYTLREPCIMCAMGLVHARAKRVFFCFDNLQYGALKSRTKLQTIPSLNHHFEVFTGFL